MDYVIRPSYVLHGQLGLLRRERPAELASATRPARPAYAFNMTFSNFLSARLLWDEAMGNGASSWLAANPGGLMVALLGNDHVKFGCGAAARCARSIGGGAPSSQEPRDAQNARARIAPSGANGTAGGFPLELGARNRRHGRGGRAPYLPAQVLSRCAR